MVGTMSDDLDNWRSALRCFVDSRRATGGVFENEASTSGTISLTDDIVRCVRDAASVSDKTLGNELVRVLLTVLGGGSEFGARGKLQLARSFRELLRRGTMRDVGRRLGGR